MKNWKTMGFLGLLATFILIFGCSNEGELDSRYKIEYKFVEDTKNYDLLKKNLISQRDSISFENPLWIEINQKLREHLQSDLDKIQPEIKLEVMVRGPVNELVILITDSTGNAVATKKVSKTKMMDNIEKVIFQISSVSGVYYIKKGDYSLIIKTFEPEKTIYRASIRISPQNNR